MLRRSLFIYRPSLLAVAMNVLDCNSSQINSASSGQRFGVAPTPQTKVPWIDRDEERAVALTEHRHSEVYRELHRRPSKNTELGLYGGEPGFERTPRVWVDPDNPHLTHMWNTAPLSINTRWARYGHFKRELHIIDIDKLCRHARAVPGVEKLLTDLTTARVALDDDGCSALIRHGARTLHHLIEDCRGEKRADELFAAIQGVFERFLVAVSPPMYAGVRTHSDMIRCCSLMKNKWNEGFYQYRQRAVEEAADAKLRREQILHGRSRKSSRRNNKSDDGQDQQQEQPQLLEVGDQFSRDALLNDPALSPFGNSVNRNNNNNNIKKVEEEENDLTTYSEQNDNNEIEVNSSLPSSSSTADQVAYRSHNAHLFELDSEFYDAVIELCIVHEKYEECVKQLYELIESKHRPRIASLANGLIAATYLRDTELGDEIPKLVQLYRLAPTVHYYEALAAYCAMVRPAQSWAVFLEAMSTPIRDSGNILKSGVAGNRSAAEIFRGAAHSTPSATHGHLVPRGDAGSLGDHNVYGDSNSSGGLLPDRDASYNPARFDNRHRVVMPTGRTVSWSILGLANNDNCTSTGEVLKLLDTASGKGIAMDYEHYTFALYFAAQKSTLGLISGDEIYSFVREIVSERMFQMKVNLTPEMILFAVKALARVPLFLRDNQGERGGDGGSDPASLITACTSLALDIVASAVDTTSASSPNNSGVVSSLSNHRSSPHFSSIFYELYQLLGRAGAAATFSSTMRNYVLSRGEPVHSWLLRSWLWCNSNAEKPNGSHMTTAEAVEFLMMNRNSNNEDETATSSVTKELVMALVLCRIKHGEMTMTKGNANLVKSLSSIVLDVVDDDDNDNVIESSEEKNDAMNNDEISLFDVVEYFADLFSNIRKQETITSVANSANKKKFTSLEESLDALLNNENENNNINNLNKEIEEQRKFLEILLAPTTSSASSSSSSAAEYDTCTLLASGVLKLAEITQNNKLLSSSDSSSLLIAYAQILAGLPSEKESSEHVRRITEEFHPTPSTLRELRTKWTIDVYDTMLRRHGQRPPSQPRLKSILPHAMQVQPFHENIRH